MLSCDQHRRDARCPELWQLGRRTLVDADSGAAGSAGGQPDGHVAGTSGTHGGGSSASDGSVGARCGASVCGAGSFCCGPRECGFCAPNGSGPFCGLNVRTRAPVGPVAAAGHPVRADQAARRDSWGHAISFPVPVPRRADAAPRAGPPNIARARPLAHRTRTAAIPLVLPAMSIEVSGEGICRDASFTCCWNCL